ncbi:hypothetical protein D1AOALGA4SA_9874 [Olavius algarvensis Delta 1 endosymbiont]|nr:hypothetical protein D1AOALGA4SA_9874 [Olavius algarvensis Delta 1 endosymbiont]
MRRCCRIQKVSDKLVFWARKPGSREAGRPEGRKARRPGCRDAEKFISKITYPSQ